MKTVKTFILGVAALASVTACNQAQKTAGNAADVVDSATTPGSTTATGTANAPAANNDISLSGRDDMTYSDTLFTVAANKPVTITFKNEGKMPKEAMGHNVIVLQPGTDIVKFATAAMKASATDYVPADEKASVVAHTKTLGPGEQDKITFTITKAGSYPFICSFPGHYGSMKGHIIAQ